jgi:adenosylhomocysteine nucleosidase
MIAITFALPAESSGILRRLNSKRVAVSKAGRIFSGQLAKCEVVIFHTGVGKKASGNIEVFLESFRPQLLISSGFAGSLTDELQVGDLIVAENFSDPTVVSKLMEDGAPATSENLPVRLEQPVGSGSVELAPSPAHEAVLKAVRLLTVPSMIDSTEERGRIAKQHNADAIDMETDMIAQFCSTRGIPLLSLRVISDSPTEPFPAPPRVLFDITRQKTNFRQLVPYIIAHPVAIGRLVTFARQVSRARAVLTNAIADAVAKLGRVR